MEVSNFFKVSKSLPKPEERPRMISAFYLCAYSGFIIPVIGVGVLTQFINLTSSLILLNLFATLIVIYVLFYSVKFKQFYVNKRA